MNNDMEDQPESKNACSPTEEDLPVPDWPAIPSGPLEIIGSRLNSVEHLRLRQVCSWWRASSPRRKKFPFLVMTCHRNIISFYDLVLKETIALPRSLQSPQGVKYGGVSFGWMALVREEPEVERIRISLVNPFTSVRVELSEIIGLRLFAGSILLSGSPVDAQQRTMVLYHNFYSGEIKFQRVGNDEWKSIQHTSSLKEIISCNGLFYGFDTSNVLYSVDLQANNGNGAVVQLPLDLPDMFSGVPPPRFQFLARFSGDLVVMCSDHNERQLFLKVDFENLRLVLMPNMADGLLFQSQSCSVYVPGDQRSSQYFCRDGQYIVHTGSPNHMIVISAKYWRHPDRRIRWRAFPLGWIRPDLSA